VSSSFGSSFNDKPVSENATGPLGKELFEREQEDLLSDLKDIPKKACDRRVSLLHSFLLSLYSHIHNLIHHLLSNAVTGCHQNESLNS